MIKFIFGFIIFFVGCNQSTQEKIQIDSVREKEKKIVIKQWYKPDINTTWQWQLTGKINTNYDVDVYDIDLFDSNISVIKSIQAEGKKVICYFSAGSYEEWREDKDKFYEDILGSNLDGWEGERWLDISNPKVLEIMKLRLDLAQQKGCDGVEPDNMDGYTNKNGVNLTYDEQLKYNKQIAQEAHKRYLSVGLKNDLEQIKLLEPYYDFAVNEQCFEYSECEYMQPFIDNNKAVFNAEYSSKYKYSHIDRDKLCTRADKIKFQTLILPLDLDDKFRYSCN
jgi:hypothetical protein